MCCGFKKKTEIQVKTKNTKIQRIYKQMQDSQILIHIHYKTKQKSKQKYIYTEIYIYIYKIYNDIIY